MFNIIFLKKIFFQSIIFILIPVFSYATEVTWGGVAFVDNKNSGTLYKNLSNIGLEKLDDWAHEAGYRGNFEEAVDRPWVAETRNFNGS